MHFNVKALHCFLGSFFVLTDLAISGLIGNFTLLKKGSVFVVIQCIKTFAIFSLSHVDSMRGNFMRWISLRVFYKLVFSIALVFSANAFSAIEEVIVTANKREQTLQEVPISVSVLSAQDISNANISNIFELQYEIPGFEARQYQNLGDAAYFIRGFGNGSNNPGVEPTVVVYLDGVPRVRMMSQISDLPNIERVEILKGPQNTIFGKNSFRIGHSLLEN